MLIIPQNADLKELRKIAYATDLRSPDLLIIEWLNELSEMLQAELLVTHISSDTLSNQENDLSEKLTEGIYQDKISKIHIRSFQGQNIKDSLHEITEQMNVDILAMMHRKYGFFDGLFHASTSHKMVKHTKIPILIFPDAE